MATPNGITGEGTATEAGLQLPERVLSLGVFIKVTEDSSNGVEVILNNSEKGDIVEAGERGFYCTTNLNSLTVKSLDSTPIDFRYSAF